MTVRNVDQVILVDSADREIGFAPKPDAHDGRGMLHRAFSLFVFNPAGELLVQRRADEKRLWPGYWSNSCCSHPRRGETMDSAIHRRLAEELAITAHLEFQFKFQYWAQDTRGSEHELCWVYAGCSAERPRPNRHEIAAWSYLSPRAIDIEMAYMPQIVTPWFRMEWARFTESVPGRLAPRRCG
ncbi:isopentenyl-diphosphate delta-isomerase [Mycobacterium sp. CBMA 234]|uniref:isopentenyl-diphosphate Delta-isomerase n=1 Tax=Mycolicibacterium sp. CBMA 234 TaxID=1918495 RepID=UPI0012DF02B5|nr:isopentenyl-diphosphate Delta-isomerase [Mycolicibacterium sp. CBMA 234]MUL64465.1 isopentenyl-diphosphate delta-isomerase [Mycolicibacterium sp. CBMA 234]